MWTSMSTRSGSRLADELTAASPESASSTSSNSGMTSSTARAAFRKGRWSSKTSTRTGPIATSASERNRARDRRPAARGGVDLQRPSDRTDAVAHVGQTHTGAVVLGIEAGSVVCHVEPELLRLLPGVDGRRRPFPCVLRCVLERLEAAEVDRRLDVGLVARDAVHLDTRPDRRTPGRSGQGLDEASILEQRRVDAMGQIA